MRRLGMPVSDTTILAGLRKHARARSESSAVAAVHVAGVDDWAWRKGSNYGTIIVDLERREVVDVLVDRSAATTASWFKDHPDVEVVSRDRAGLYAEAAREGAPQARQVADRFHLLQNFRETIERQLGGYEADSGVPRVNPDDSQATMPLLAQSDCASDAVTQTRVMRRGRLAIRHELCNQDIYPIYTVRFVASPMLGVNDKYFNKLYVEMAAANGFHSFAFVDPGWDVIVTVDVPDKKEISISYYEFDAPGAK